MVVAAPFAEGGDEFIRVDLEKLLVVEIEGRARARARVSITCFESDMLSESAMRYQ